MNRPASFWTVFAFWALTAACSSVYGGAIINGSFETGTGADANNWNEIEVAGGTMGAAATADRDTTNPNTGTAAMFLEVTGADDFGPVAEIQQQTAVGSIVPGSTYDFGFSSQGIAGPGTVAFYEVLWFDGDGSSGGGPQGSATGLTTYPLTASYAQTAVTGLTAPAGADSALIQIRLVTGAFDGASGSAYIDDVSFCAVPEPADSMLAPILAICLFGLKRRKMTSTAKR